MARRFRAISAAPSSMPIPPVRPRLDLRRRNSASRRKARPPAPADCFRRPAQGNGRRSARRFAAATTGGARTRPLRRTRSRRSIPNSLQNMQDHKLAFLNGPTDRRTVSSDRLMNPASSYVLQAGTVIPAALITGIQSDLPGLITAQVTENVYDSPTGRFLLVPQGAKLIGSYDSQVSFGQSRVLLVWNRIVFPNGQSIVLEHQPGADTEGYAGLEDGVDYHWGNLLKTAALSTLLGVGAELGSNGNQSDLVRALQRGSQEFDQSVRPATRPPPDQCPADPHHPARLPGPGPRQPRSRARAISGIRTWHYDQTETLRRAGRQTGEDRHRSSRRRPPRSCPLCRSCSPRKPARPRSNRQSSSRR